MLNLGISGLGSEEVLDIVRRFVPELRPDLVVYGVCLNDFLPRGVKEYSTPQIEWIPTRLKVFLASRTRVGALVRDSYQDLLIHLGIRHDFYDDILKDFDSYKTRFRGDLRAINEFVIARGLPPVIMVVFDQNPQYGGRGYRIARIAEEAGRRSGMDVVETEDYYRNFDGARMGVSRWEGHPNAEAHRLFAALLLPVLEKHPVLQHCFFRDEEP